MTQFTRKEQPCSLGLCLKILNYFISDYRDNPVTESSFRSTSEITKLAIQIFSPKGINCRNMLSIAGVVSFILSFLKEANIVLDSQFESIWNDYSHNNYTNYALLLCFYCFFEGSNYPFEKLNKLNQHYQFQFIKMLHSFIDCEQSLHGCMIKYLLSLHTKISILEIKVNEYKKKTSSFQTNDSNHSNTKNETSIGVETTDSPVTCENQFDYPNKRIHLLDSPLQFNMPNSTFKQIDQNKPSNKKNDLTEQDYLKIIIKKDYQITNLNSLLEKALNQKDINKELLTSQNKEIDYYKKENERFESRYEMEFELMASAMYNIGISYLQLKEDSKMNNKGSQNWLMRQRQLYLNGNYNC